MFLIFQQPGTEGPAATMEDVRHRYRMARREEAKATVQALWDTLTADCMCLGEDPSNGSSQPSQDVNCPYCVASENGEEIHEATRACQNKDCRVCMFINKCTVAVAISIGENKNARLSAYLSLSKYVASIVNSTELPDERRKSMTGLLCKLFCCKLTRVRNIGNVGFLSELCPHLEYLQLQKGWGDFWGELSKLGTALGYHRDRESQVAALIYLRRQCIRDDNSLWHWYLQSEDVELEARLRTTVFAGCFTDALDRAAEGSSTD